MPDDFEILGTLVATAHIGRRAGFFNAVVCELCEDQRAIVSATEMNPSYAMQLVWDHLVIAHRDLAMKAHPPELVGDDPQTRYVMVKVDECADL